jgi:ATP-binding cassette subfamily B protein
MADFFETEEVVKDYDSRIFGRIVSYLKPYRGLVALTLAALAISTIGELFVPLLQQRVIDKAIVVKFIVINEESLLEKEKLENESLNALETLLSLPDSVSAGGRLFIPLNGKAGISRKTEGELLKNRILENDNWYVFNYEAGSEKENIVLSRKGLFHEGKDGAGGEKSAAILSRDLYSLTVKEISLIRSGDIEFIVRSVIFLLLILVLVFLFTFLQTWSSSLIGQLIMKDIRLALFKKTASQSTAFLSRHPVGRLVTRLSGDVETINEFFTTVLSAFLKDLSIMAGVLITLFALSPRLALAVLACMPPVLVITAISRVKARDAFRRQRTASSRVNSYLSERLSGIQVVQLFLGEKKSLGEFSERNHELLRANMGEMYVFAIFRPAVEWLGTFTAAVVLVAGAVMILNLSVSLGVLIAFTNLVAMFFNPVMDIAEKYTLLQSAMAGGERVFSLLDTEAVIPDTGKRAIEGTVRGHIEFDNVHFSYKKGEEVLKGLSFNVKPGEMAAIVGYTGAGKTTITNVLTRLWDPDSGSIRLDGIPIQEIPLDELRRACLPVLQDVFLFSGSIANNIRMGLPLTDSEVEEAAKAVHAHEFICRLKDGYQTSLSEGAANISSGQRQLISFARVIAHNPSIVILDEATSSIDTETERLIQLGIQRVLAGRTSIVIAHRLSTIRHADRILVLQGGRLVEEGRHEALIEKNGLYAGLYKLQYEKQHYRAETTGGAGE